MANNKTTKKILAEARASGMINSQNIQIPRNRSNRTLLLLIIAIVVVVVLIVVSGLYASGVIGAKNDSNDVSSEITDISTTLIEDKLPIYYSSLGVGVDDPDVEDLYLYFDYSCHSCAQVDDYIFSDLVADVEKGRYDLVLVPVKTVNYTYHPIATYAALLVAENDPTHFIDFHEELMGFFWQEYNRSSSSTVQSAEKSFEKVKSLAKDVGVADIVIDAFSSTGAVNYLTTMTTNWQNREVENRGDSLGTPEFVYRDAKISLDSGSAERLHNSILNVVNG